MRRDEILECAKRCDPFPDELQDATRLEGGCINENWRILSEQGSRVLRIYPESRRLRQIEFELSLQRYLRERQLQVPQVLGGPFQWQGQEGRPRPVVWLEYLDAQPLSPQQAQVLPVIALTELLAPILEHLESFPPPFRPAHETRIFERRLPTLLAQLNELGKFELREYAARLFEKLRHWERSIKLPSSAIHADIHPGNVLASHEKMWLIDFDDAHVGWRAIDWILPALEFSLDPHTARVDEARYAQLLESLSATRVKPEEQRAFGNLRLLLELKFATSLAVSGKTFEQNPYLRLLERRFLQKEAP